MTNLRNLLRKAMVKQGCFDEDDDDDDDITTPSKTTALSWREGLRASVTQRPMLTGA
jgi:hypothetical protein